MEPEILYALGAFALVSGRVCGGIQWHRWNRRRQAPKERREQVSDAKPA